MKQYLFFKPFVGHHGNQFTTKDYNPLQSTADCTWQQKSVWATGKKLSSLTFFSNYEMFFKIIFDHIQYFKPE